MFASDIGTYPVAIYDHNEGQAVSGGFAYYGRVAVLRGKFVFGDHAHQPQPRRELFITSRQDV